MPGRLVAVVVDEGRGLDEALLDVGGTLDEETADRPWDRDGPLTHVQVDEDGPAPGADGVVEEDPAEGRLADVCGPDDHGDGAALALVGRVGAELLEGGVGVQVLDHRRLLARVGLHLHVATDLE